MKIPKSYMLNLLLAGGVAAPVVAVASQSETKSVQVSSAKAVTLEEVKAALNELRGDTTAPSTSYAFLNIPVVETSLVRIDYFVTPGLSLNEAKLSPNWQSQLPQVVSAYPYERVLYARVSMLAEPGNVQYYNLTESSLIRVTKMHFSDSRYEAILKRELGFNGDISVRGNQELTLKEPILTSAVSLAYQILPSQNLLSKDEMLSILNAQRTSLDEDDLGQVRVVVLIRDKYRFYDEVTSYSVDFSNVKLEPRPGSSEIFNKVRIASSQLHVTSSSVHDNVTFEGQIPPIKYVASIEYLSTEVSTIAEAQRQSGWSTSLPTELPIWNKSRHLFARAKLVSFYSFPIEMTSYYDLTATSGVQYLKINFLKTDDFKNFSFSKLQLTGDLIQAVPVIAINELNTAPQGTNLTYQINGGAWLTKDQMVKELNRLGKTLTPVMISSLRAKLKAVFLQTYAAGEVVSAIDFSAFRI